MWVFSIYKFLNFLLALFFSFSVMDGEEGGRFGGGCRQAVFFCFV